MNTMRTVVRRGISCLPGFPFGAALAGSTLRSLVPGPKGFLLALLSMLLILAWMVVKVVQIGAAIWEHRWHRAATRLIVLAIALPLVVIGAASGDYLHLAILYPYYRTQISQISGRPVRFPWGEQAVAVTDGIQLRALLYDDTGKVAAGVSRTGEGLCTIDHPLIGDFYIEEDISVQNTTRCGNAQW